MLARRCWFDLKPRFFWTAGFFLISTTTLFFLYNSVVDYNNSGAVSYLAGPVKAFYTRAFEDYFFYVDQVWFYDRLAYFEFFTIVLAWGGILVYKKKADLLMIFSLPVKRSHWFMVHGGMTACLLIILIFGFTLFVLGVNHIIFGSYYPPDTALIKAFSVWLACLPWIGISLLANSFFKSGFKSMMVLIIVFASVVSLRLSYHSVTHFLLYRPFLNPDGQISFSWTDLLVVILTTLGTTALAIWKFGKDEF